MLKQHKYYVYNEQDRVMARMDANDPVVAEVCKGGSKDKDGVEMTAYQEAHAKVQAIINPKGLKPEQVCPKTGFHHEKFQREISGNAKEYVEAAYAKAAKAVKAG